MSIEPTMNFFVKKTGGWVASQLEACTRCGMCADACPYYLATGKPEYTPIWKPARSAASAVVPVRWASKSIH